MSVSSKWDNRFMKLAREISTWSNVVHAEIRKMINTFVQQQKVVMKCNRIFI